MNNEETFSNQDQESTLGYSHLYDWSREAFTMDINNQMCNTDPV